jgi:hypothetical protein
MATYLVVLAVIRWETLLGTWSRTRHRVARGWNKVSTRHSELEDFSAEENEEERPKSRLMKFRAKLRLRQGEDHGTAEEIR